MEKKLYPIERITNKNTFGFFFKKRFLLGRKGIKGICIKQKVTKKSNKLVYILLEKRKEIIQKSRKKGKGKFRK